MRITSLCLLCVLSFAAHAQDSTQSQLVGKYKFPDGSVVTEVVVTLDNGALTMTSSAGTSPLERVKGDTFNIVNFNGIAVFKRNDAKKVIGVHIDASGYVLDGDKQSAALADQRLLLAVRHTHTIRRQGDMFRLSVNRQKKSAIPIA